MNIYDAFKISKAGERISHGGWYPNRIYIPGENINEEDFKRLDWLQVTGDTSLAHQLELIKSQEDLTAEAIKAELLDDPNAVTQEEVKSILSESLENTGIPIQPTITGNQSMSIKVGNLHEVTLNLSVFGASLGYDSIVSVISNNPQSASIVSTPDSQTVYVKGNQAAQGVMITGTVIKAGKIYKASTSIDVIEASNEPILDTNGAPINDPATGQPATADKVTLTIQVAE